MDTVKRHNYENVKIFMYNPIKENFHYKKNKTEKILKDYVFLNKERLLR